MARIRTIKPEVSLHDGLYDLEVETGFPIRFVWSVFPCHCDREGRFEWKPRRLKVSILPYDDLDFSRVLDALWTRGFIEKYVENGREFGVIPTFLRHQVVNNRESESVLPEPNKNNVLPCKGRVTHASITREVQDKAEGKGKEGKGKEGNTRESQKVFEMIINHLNQKTQSNFKLVDSNIKFIQGRINEGYSEQDLIAVINQKTSEWMDDPKMRKYLRPSTLFNAEKFSQYFGQVLSGDEYSELSTFELIELAEERGIKNARTMNTSAILHNLREVANG